MSLSVVRHAVKQGKQNVTETVATGPAGKCSPRYVLSVAKTLKYRSSPVKADRYIVVIATVSKDQVDNVSLALRTYRPGVSPAYMCF